MIRLAVTLISVVLALNAWLLWMNFGTRTWQLGAAILVSYASLWGVYFGVSKRPRRQKQIRLIATSFMMLLLLAMFELGTLTGVVDYRRVLGGLADPNRRPWDNPTNRLDKDLLHIHQPNSHHQGQVLGNFARHAKLPDPTYYEFDVQYDDHGFRNAATVEQSDIILIGDSFVEAALVEYDKILSSALSKQLATPVQNLGQAAYGPQQEFHVLRKLGVGLRPQTCVWLFYEGNDLRDASEYGQRVTDWQTFMKQRDRFWQRSFSRNLLHALPKLVNPDPPKREFWRRVAVLHDASVYFMHQGRALNEAEERGLLATSQVLSEAFKLCQQNQIRFVFALAPTKFRVYQPLCQLPDESLCVTWILNDLPERMRKLVSQISPEILFIDLTNALREATRVEPTYFPDDTHWNAAGHAAAAQEIARRIKDTAPGKREP